MEHSCAHGLLVNSSDTGDLKVGQKVDLSVKSSVHRVCVSTCNRITESDHVSLRNRHLWILRFRFEWGVGNPSTGGLAVRLTANRTVFSSQLVVY